MGSYLDAADDYYETISLIEKHDVSHGEETIIAGLTAHSFYMLFQTK
jgi:hypothetical protein